jgi:hypothetical protein
MTAIMTSVMIEWDEHQLTIARLALSQLSYATDTGDERAVIAGMLADLSSSRGSDGKGSEVKEELPTPSARRDVTRRDLTRPGSARTGPDKARHGPARPDGTRQGWLG